MKKFQLLKYQVLFYYIIDKNMKDISKKVDERGLSKIYPIFIVFIFFFRGFKLL